MNTRGSARVSQSYGNNPLNDTVDVKRLTRRDQVIQTIRRNKAKNHENMK